jgi:ATP-dependent DNA helicase RecQ
MAAPTAIELLRQLTGNPESTFREGQLEAIERLVERRGRVLVVQRTGWGKSAVYFIATRLLRDQGAGPTILISPLLALMRNQIEAAERAGVVAATINSSNTDDWAELEDRVRGGEVDLLLISPERLNNDRFREDVLPHLVRQVGLLVVDEAHCISDWGHDFRPDYRRIARILLQMPATVPVLCTTATANDRVIDDVRAQLGEGLEVLRGTLDRVSLRLSVLTLPTQTQRLAWLSEALPRMPGSGIVYCLTVRDTRRVARWLQSRGITAEPYSGDEDPQTRIQLEQALLNNELKVLVATSALGMGFDKPDLGFVIHFQSPGSPIAYYQQVGRAGRALEVAEGVLLCGHEDREIQDYFIRVAFPPQSTAEAVVELLAEKARAVSMAELERVVNLRQSRLTLLLKVLEVEGAVERIDGGWRRTLRPWAYDTERVAQVSAHRRVEQQAMLTYATPARCRMRQLRELLDDPSADDCGRCDVCAGNRWDLPQPTELVQAAIDHLRREELTFEPRKRWLGGGDPGSPVPTGSIPAEQRLETGWALSIFGDGGWGTMVRDAKYAGGPTEELFAALRDLWLRCRLDPAPTWVTYVPSHSSDLVRRAAESLSASLGLPLLEVIQRPPGGVPQKEMENSSQQLANVYGSIVVTSPVPPGPVLLVDDIVDSRWTLTVAGAGLRQAGSGPVFPLVLAMAVGT